MKKNRLVFLLVLIVGAVLISACGNEANNGSATTEEKKDEVVGNEKNAEAVVKALSDSEVRFKIYINDAEPYIFALNTSLSMSENGHVMEVGSKGVTEGTTYGFDDPEKGTSVYAFAKQKGLNEEQRKAISSLASPKDLFDLPEGYPEDFSFGGYPYLGADFDYVTLSNVKKELTNETEHEFRITADLTAHFHLVDGTEKTKKYEVSSVPEAGNEELDEDSVEVSLHADKMNEDIPNEKRSSYEEKGSNPDE